jgi:predicted RNA-binding protein (virulence factor B family)
MATLGKFNTLRVVRHSAHGFYLDGEALGDILLPRGLVPEGTEIDDEVKVFLYRDSEDRLVATTDTPLAQVGEFASLRVTGFNPKIGAFLDWGLPKDLLLPHREQESPVRVGDDVVVFLQVDPKTDRIHATARLDAHLSSAPPLFEIGEPVTIYITRETPLGYVALVEGAHLGLLYHQDLRMRVHPGQRHTAYIAAVREDGKIDLVMDSSGRHRVTSLGDQILEALVAHGGQMDLDDDSPPEAIRDALGASKKAFKQAIGGLYRQGKIKLLKPGIALA